MTFVSKPMKELKDYTEMDLNRVFGIPSITCPHCTKTITIDVDLHKTSEALKRHAATHKDPAMVERDLISLTMNEVVWHHHTLTGGKR